MTARKFIQVLCGSVGAGAVVWLVWTAWAFGMVQLRQHDALLAVMRVGYTIACIVGGALFAMLAFLALHGLARRRREPIFRKG